MENPNKVNVYRFYDDEIYLEFIVHKEGGQVFRYYFNKSIKTVNMLKLVSKLYLVSYQI